MTEYDGTILLITREGLLFPFNPEGFTRADGPKRKVVDGNVGALVLAADGLREIASVEILGPYGDGKWRRVWSRLTDWWRIRVHLSAPLAITLEDLKAKLVAGIARSAAEHIFYDDDPAAPARISAAVRSATSARELLQVMELGTLENALDVL